MTAEEKAAAMYELGRAVERAEAGVLLAYWCFVGIVFVFVVWLLTVEVRLARLAAAARKQQEENARAD